MGYVTRYVYIVCLILKQLEDHRFRTLGNSRDIMIRRLRTGLQQSHLGSPSASSIKGSESHRRPGQGKPRVTTSTNQPASSRSNGGLLTALGVRRNDNERPP